MYSPFSIDFVAWCRLPLSPHSYLLLSGDDIESVEPQIKVFITILVLKEQGNRFLWAIWQLGMLALVAAKRCVPLYGYIAQWQIRLPHHQNNCRLRASIWVHMWELQKREVLLILGPYLCYEPLRCGISQHWHAILWRVSSKHIIRLRFPFLLLPECIDWLGMWLTQLRACTAVTKPRVQFAAPYKTMCGGAHLCLQPWVIASFIASRSPGGYCFVAI